MANQLIRDTAQKNGVRLWQIADAIGINDGNFSRRLRHELPPDEQARLLGIIDKLAAGETGVNP